MQASADQGGNACAFVGGRRGVSSHASAMTSTVHACERPAARPELHSMPHAMGLCSVRGTVFRPLVLPRGVLGGDGEKRGHMRRRERRIAIYFFTKQRYAKKCPHLQIAVSADAERGAVERRGGQRDRESTRGHAIARGEDASEARTKAAARHQERWRRKLSDALMGLRSYGVTRCALDVCCQPLLLTHWESSEGSERYMYMYVSVSGAGDGLRPAPVLQRVLGVMTKLYWLGVRE